MVVTLLMVSAACSASPTIRAANHDRDTAVVSETDELDPSSTSATQSDPQSDNDSATAAASAPAVASPRPGLKVMPPAVSTIRSVGQTGLYYAYVKHDMVLVGFDLSTGRGRYHLDAHPLGRIRGVAQDLVVDPDLSLAFITAIDDDTDENSAYLAAIDAATGEQVWRTAIDYWASQPRDCGSTICIRSSEMAVEIDKRTGEVVNQTEVTDRRVFLDTDTVRITSHWSDGFDGLIVDRLSDNHRWTVSRDRIEEELGSAIDPSFGWAGYRDEANRASVIFLRLATGEGWGSVGILDEGSDEQIVWASRRLSPCIDSPFDPSPPLVCRVDPTTGAFTELLHLDIASADFAWKALLDDRFLEAIYDGTKVLIWSQDKTIGSYIQVDLATGQLAAGTEAALCIVPQDWMTFAYPDGEQAVWAPATLYSACLPDGRYGATADIVAASQTLGLGANSFWLVDDSGVPVTPTTG